nr:hypothetical protein B0A51_17097 [Rachicladosporium sp. CCFEE 5018]
MESAVLNTLFRRLATHRFCQRGAPAIHHALPTGQRRHSSRYPHTPPQSRGPSSKRPKTSVESNWQQRTDAFPEDKADEFHRYPLVTATDLRTRKERPRRVKMLMRDFIEDSLYNPTYGYFSKNVTIFNAGEPFDFNSIPDEPAFQRVLGQRYTEFEDKLDAIEYNETRQLWHTPTELFQPYYAEAIARYMVSNYKLSLYPYHDLLIYELGAGNGTLMLNILDYIRRTDPQVYARTKFRIIEISPMLASLQQKAADRGHAHCVDILNLSIFDWKTYTPDPCFFLALEVFDNFPHDILRYNPFTSQPLQGQVLIDSAGDFFEFYTPHLDPLASRYLQIRSFATQNRLPPTHPLRSPAPWLRKLRHSLPMAPNLTQPEYIPTRLLHFFTLLSKHFPAHRLITSDFSSLPNATPGHNAPVVQTRYQRRTIPVSTPLVQQGYFDILFPTDFGVMEGVYRAVTGRLTRVEGHGEFMERWSDLEGGRLGSGENVLGSGGWFGNAKVMVTV